MRKIHSSSFLTLNRQEFLARYLVHCAERTEQIFQREHRDTHGMAVELPFSTSASRGRVARGIKVETKVIRNLRSQLVFVQHGQKQRFNSNHILDASMEQS